MAGSTTLIVLLVIGCFISLIGVALIPVANKVIDDMVVDQIVLKNGSTGYENWIDAPVPVYIQFWVWDCINSLEVMKGEKPYFVQKGPYSYREYWPKENITFYDNHTISYTAPKTYVFEPSMSVGDPLEDKFTTLNVPLMTIVNLLQYESGPINGILALIMEIIGYDTFLTLSVHDILWGYEDPLLKLAHELNLMPSSYFGFYAGKNNTDDGEYVIYSGEDEVKKVNKIVSYKGQRSLDFWSDKYANMLNGTDGSLNPPFLKKDQKLWLFSSDICRSAYLILDKQYKYKNIKLYRYVVPPELYANVSVNPDNAGFCTPTVANCLPGGLLNGSNCQQNAPVVFSLPHFLYADADVLEMVGGMEPKKEEHQILFDAEPLTGASLFVAKRIQINIYTRPFPDIPFLKNFPKTYFPIMWLNESASATDKVVKDFKDKVQVPQKAATAVEYGLLAIGLILVITMTMILVKRRKKNDADETSPLLKDQTA
ncbi:lysosome membrane protein 2-like isoform X2 [Anneissia japonica]|uniref:lysosome membrane protein 2-like isoform X2 n=1 Tax=Anneissia japonica TaxID=1529436 RepID=UPI0014255594|nr:lysosome membrane protein 2-like isoform X2 [Anneissia japonica]